MDPRFHGNDQEGKAGDLLDFCFRRNDGEDFIRPALPVPLALLTFSATAQAQGVPQPGGQGGQQGQGQAQPQTEFARIAAEIGIDPSDFEIDESAFTPANTVRNVDANGNPTVRTTTLGGTGETGKLFINPAGSSINTNGNNVQGIIADHSAAILNQGAVSTQGNFSQAIAVGRNSQIINRGNFSSSGSDGIISSIIASAGPERPTYILNERGATITSVSSRGIATLSLAK